MRVKYMQDTSEQNVIKEETTEKAEIGNEVVNSSEESNSSELSEKLSTEELEEDREEIEEKEQRKAPSDEETEKEDTSDSELATVTRSASLTTPDDGMPMVPASGVVASETKKRQAEAGELKAGAPTTAGDEDGRRGSGHVDVGAGEWNSLPILVERLREVLELSLATGCRRSDEPTATSSSSSSAEPAGVSGEVNDRLHARRSMERAALLGGGYYDRIDPGSEKDELKFLEDLLLSDIQTALSRLRETLERTDVATLAKHGGVSDPTSKLHLLRLVSSLLSRLQVPQKETTTVNVAQGASAGGRKRRSVRHTIGVSAEEIAYARKQLEESSADLMKLNHASVQWQRESPVGSGNVLPNGALPGGASKDTPNSERHAEEICDKYTKDAMNQRQSLRDKNKDCCGDIDAYRPMTVGSGESNMPQDRRRCGNVHDEEAGIERTSEEQNRVAKLAAVLRQRAELVSASRCNANNNKFVAKKSKIKRANTVDIPSYLKLQAGGRDNSGCVQLRRPIHVGDKVALNAANNIAVPSFRPRTENDKKFLALINKNNEVQTTFNVAPAFKSFGYTKTTDMSSLANENWNSRFSNIKTAFDKPSPVNNENKLSPKPRPAKYFPSALQTPSQVMNRRTPTGIGNPSNGLPFADTNPSKPDVGFRHAPSSLFRKIEKPRSPISPPGHHWFKDNAPPAGNTLREKARIMFDRDSNVQSTSKFRIDATESSQKLSFPRPPWIERDRNEGKPSGMIAENGRLDYRLFCKQFAPFIGKNTAAEPRVSRNHEEHRKRNEHSMQPKIILPPDEMAMVDGTIPFETFPEKGSRVQQRRKSSESRRDTEGLGCDRFDLLRGEKSAFEQIRDRRCNEENLPGNAVVDATLSGSSSIAIQTGESDDNQREEVRVFRVVPRITKDQSVCNDASVQTYSQPEESLTEYIESKKERSTPRYECDDANLILNSSFHPTEDPRKLVLDHNWNYHTPTADIASKNESSMSDLIEERSSAYVPNPVDSVSYRNMSDHHSPERCERIFQISNSQDETRFPPKLASDNQPRVCPDYPSDAKSNGDPSESEISSVLRVIDKNDFSCMNDGGLPEEQNIQNQDISADAGVVTRYTCAIATVASADTSEVGSAERGPEFLISSSPSHFRPYTKEIGNDITTTEEEIRRHNMLQQSLVRRLQNERTMLNDQYAPVPKQSGGLNKSTKFPSNTAKLEPPVTGFLSIPPSSGHSAINRVTTLREQYEQPGGQPRPVPKERSPIPNGVSGAMDSSDKYLMSCSSKPAKSIVLSKSESWHQLALSNSHHPPPRPSQTGLPPTTSSHLPKLPKPKSPSFFRTKKQYEASLSSDNVRRMEDKIRRYFDHSNDNVDAKDSRGKRFSSHDVATKGLVSLSRSRTMPGICDQRLHLLVPAAPQTPVTSLSSADVDKVFDDIFEEATRTDDHRF